MSLFFIFAKHKKNKSKNIKIRSLIELLMRTQQHTNANELPLKYMLGRLIFRIISIKTVSH